VLDTTQVHGDTPANGIGGGIQDDAGLAEILTAWPRISTDARKRALELVKGEIKYKRGKAV
jgi:hypothetical protein